MHRRKEGKMKVVRESEGMKPKTKRLNKEGKTEGKKEGKKKAGKSGRKKRQPSRSGN